MQPTVHTLATVAGMVGCISGSGFLGCAHARTPAREPQLRDRSAPADHVPAFHVRPPCYSKQTPHDIAGAVYLPQTKTWHVMAGCWEYPLGDWRRAPGGWQHLSSPDLVHWRLGKLFNGTEGGRRQNCSEIPTPGCETSLGNSGGLAIDDDGRAFAYSGAKPLLLHRAADDTLDVWEPRISAWNRSDPAMQLHHPSGPGDPVVWKGQLRAPADGAGRRGAAGPPRWFFAAAERWSSPAGPAQCNSTAKCGGFEEMCSAASLWPASGVAADGAAAAAAAAGAGTSGDDGGGSRGGSGWVCSNRSLFNVNQQSMLPAVIPHRKGLREFVTPDFFGNLMGDVLAGTESELKCFLTSNSVRGPVVRASEWNRTRDEWVVSRTKNVTTATDYASLTLGTQDDGAEFKPLWASSTAVDYGSFTTNASSVSGLDVAVSYGGSTLGCCPKTAAMPHSDGQQRRVLFGWMHYGYGHSGGIASTLKAENTISLPRDLSTATAAQAEAIAAAGSAAAASVPQLRQSFVPELQALRVGAPATLPRRTVLAPGVTMLPAAFGGNQLEVRANFSISTAKGVSAGSSRSGNKTAAVAVAQFGLWVLASVIGSGERTAIVFDSARGLILVDRRESRDGQSNDTDVRAGPWPLDAATGTGLATELSLHLYVDHSIVELIVNDVTAITVYVHPKFADSTQVAIFAGDGGGSGKVSCEHLEVWKLAAAPLSKADTP
jgi:sucrose-6-phosphate hydrolase SacC (GH32 family)